MKAWNEFKRKQLGKVGKALSFLSSVVGLVLSIISFAREQFQLGWAIVLTLVVFNSIVLIVVTVYETSLYERGTKISRNIARQKEAENDILLSKLDSWKELHNRTTYYFQYLFSTLNAFNVQLGLVNKKYLENNEIFDLIGKDCPQGRTQAEEEKVKKLLNDSAEEYRLNIRKEYDHFLANVIGKLKETLDVALENKGYRLEVSISIKQFNRVVTNTQNLEDVRILTTFRDHKTYSQSGREVASKEYTIDRNSDFRFCLDSSSSFLKNNIVKNKDMTYVNENSDFLSHYDSTIVVPIQIKNLDQKYQTYGFLTCDTLCKNNKKEPFDKEMAEIMRATARAIGMYFDNMQSQCRDILKADAFETIYKMKKK